GQIAIEPCRTFAGFGFTIAIKEFREQLIGGQRIRLRAIGFTPSPKAVEVEIHYHGLEQMRMSNRVLRGDCFTIHAEIPRIAQLFVKVPDTHIWLLNPPPAGFLRWEGSLVEPGDPVVRVDLLPGNESGSAEPVRGSS